MLGETRIRPSRIAGTWYPADPGELAKSIDHMLAGSAGPRAGDTGGAELVGIVVPHAAHRYSGAVAAAGFRLLSERQWHTVLVIGPNHRVPAQASLLIADAAAYTTPLGLVPVDRNLVAALAQKLPVRLLRDDAEHSVEIQLPFLQRRLSPLPPLLPLMVGYPDLSFARRLAEALAELLRGRKTLLVMSSDWSHYYPESVARRMDHDGIKHLLNLDAEGFAAALATGRTQACGAGALLTGILLSRAWSAERAMQLAYATSGDITGDRGRVVGYAAVALLQRRPLVGMDANE